MTVFVQDTFTDTTGTDLASHTGEVGATWATGTPTPVGVVITSAGRIRCGTTAGYLYASGTPASAEYDVEADFQCVTALVDAGICGRMKTNAETMYRLRWITGTNAWQLHKLVNGASTTLGTYADMPTAGASRAAKLEIRDATKKAYINDVERISSTDNAITAADTVGVRFGLLATPDDTKAIHIDNFVATDSSGGGAPEERTPFGIFVPKTYRKPIHYMGV